MDKLERAGKISFLLIKDHVLLKQASKVAAVDEKAKQLLTEDFLKSVVSLIPNEWLNDNFFETPQEFRDAYLEFLTTRLTHSNNFIKAIEDARTALI